MPPKISVILPVYNTEQYLPACLDSILSQPMRDLEILAVDNGCTDGCGSILADYAARDSRVRVIERIHGEAGEARNSALAAAQGEYLAFCDSDDTLPADAYSAILEHARRTGCDVAVANYFSVSDSGARTPVRLSSHQKKRWFQVFFSAPCVWNKLIRRAFLREQNLRFPSLVMGEDVVFLAQLLRENPKISCVDSFVYEYWHHTQAHKPSMTHRYTLAFFRLHLIGRREMLATLRGTAYEREAQEGVYLGMIHFLLAFLYRIPDLEERAQAFEEFRDHVLEYDWSQQKRRFEAIFGVSIDRFSALTCDEFLFDTGRMDHREMVRREYLAGEIGLRYLFRYAAAWLDFKLTKGR